MYTSCVYIGIPAHIRVIYHHHRVAVGHIDWRCLVCSHRVMCVVNSGNWHNSSPECKYMYGGIEGKVGDLKGGALISGALTD